ncbi:MAG: amidohydrolase family protein [Hyphomicrobiales bacterium]|nr:amidohydrolase family protein [Hyphomicrobiales bacterium]
MSGALPRDACDCHMHFYRQGDRAAPATATGFSMPTSNPDICSGLMERLGLTRFVAVQSIAYGFDNDVIIQALDHFAGAGRGIVVIPTTTAISELLDYDRRGVRGIHGYMLEGGSYTWDDLAQFAPRITELGWHTQLQLDGNRLGEFHSTIEALPCDVVIDHLGKFLDQPTQTAVAALLKLLDNGKTWVKLSAPYENWDTEAPCYPGVADLAWRLVRHAPERMLWGTNFPHPGRTSPPSEEHLLYLLADWAEDEPTMHRILGDNPQALYRF